MEKSQTEWDLFTGNIKDYVTNRVTERFGEGEFVNSLPICSSVNIIKKITETKASIYKNPPSREFINASERQEEVLKLIYKDAKANFNFKQANNLFELQKEQTHILIEPKNGKIVMRPIKAHNLNVKPNDIDPEVAEVYIFSAFNKADNDQMTQTSDGINQSIADREDYKKASERYIWWSKDYHFVTDGKGEIKTDKENPTANDFRNPIGMMPVIEIADTKDFTYWREITNDMAEYTIDLNADLTMLNQIVELQGFSQAYLKGSADILPQTVNVGPNKILKLVTDPASDSDTEFGYASPNSDVAASVQYLLDKISLTLSSQGVDPDIVSAKGESNNFNSGLERIVAQIEKFEASRNTITLFRDGEEEVFKVIKAWHNLAVKVGSEKILKKKYVSTQMSDEVMLEVNYKEPTAILSELDRVDLAERKQSLGVYDDIEIYATAEGVTRDVALKKIEEMNGNSGQEDNPGR